MKMPDEINVPRGLSPDVYSVSNVWGDGATKYIRKDIHEEKIEVLRRIISGLEADIRKLKGK